jgi:hypothetical protein
VSGCTKAKGKRQKEKGKKEKGKRKKAKGKREKGKTKTTLLARRGLLGFDDVRCNDSFQFLGFVAQRGARLDRTIARLNKKPKPIVRLSGFF